MVEDVGDVRLVGLAAGKVPDWQKLEVGKRQTVLAENLKYAKLAWLAACNAPDWRD